MTVAFNLSQLANYVNSSGKLDITNGVTSAANVANGGTGRSTLTANSLLAGNTTSAVNLIAPGTNGNILTSNGTSWVSAAPASVTFIPAVDALGCVMCAIRTTNSDLGGVGTTESGSNLRYNWTIADISGITTTGQTYPYGDASYVVRKLGTANPAYNAGGTSLTGTWRKLSTGITWQTTDDGEGNYYSYWYQHLWIRIS